MAENGQAPKVPYPWRIAENGLGQENYETEEESFRDTNETTEKPCIWQVYNSQVTEVKESEFFKFYNNRAYIVLAMEEKDTIRPEGFRNLHIWVSKYCHRQDYELAVARADQLSKMLKNPKPAVHREIQHYETDAFHNHHRILEVRIWREKVEDPPKPRLLQFHSEDTVHRLNKKSSFKGQTRQIPSDESSKRLKKQWMVERELLRGNLITGDVFVVMNPSDFEIIQWNGQKSNPEEREIAKKFIEEEQKKYRTEKKLKLNHATVDEGKFDKNHKLYTLFPPTATKRKISVSSETKAKIGMKFKKFYCLTDSNGRLGKASHDDRNMSKSNLPSKHVYLIDTDYHVFVWIGEDWKNMVEKNDGEFPPLMLFYEAAERFLHETYGSIKEEEVEDMFHLPMNKPITLVHEDDQCLPLDKALSGH